MKTKLLKEDLGILGSRIWLYVGPHTKKNLIPLFRALKFVGDEEDALLRESETCFGACYWFPNGNSCIWINPTNTIEETYEAVSHELSHAIDCTFEAFGFTCKELRARVTGILNRKFLKGLNLIVKK